VYNTFFGIFHDWNEVRPEGSGIDFMILIFLANLSNNNPINTASKAAINIICSRKK
jgi:hypothetical protein